jgi:hypothetical protein
MQSVREPRARDSDEPHTVKSLALAVEPAQQPAPSASAAPAAFLAVDSLAAMRIALACVVLLDLCLRAVDLGAFYTDAGVLPRPLALDAHYNRFRLSLHLANDTPAFQGLLFIAAAASACLLLVGWHTRLATLVSWFLLASLHNRNPTILNGGDDLLRVLLFWSIFLPLGARHSVDQLHGRASSGSSLANIAGVVFAAQLALVYISSAVHKLHEQEWREGLGLYYAFATEQHATRIGQWLAAYPELLRPFSMAAIACELLLPILIFCPWRRPLVRTALVGFFVAFHLSISLALDVGLFTPIAIVAWLALLPASAWRRVPRPAVRWLSLRLAQAAHRLAPLEAPRASLQRDAATRWLRVVNASCILLGLYVLAWNTSAWGRPSLFRIPEWMRPAAMILGLQQRWEMFARPTKQPGYWLIPGKLADGSDVELFTGNTDLLQRRPQLISATIPNEHWRKYMNFIGDKNRDPFRLRYGRYLCQSWNTRHPKERQLEAFKIFSIRHRVLPTAGYADWRATMLWQHECKTGLLKKWGVHLRPPPANSPLEQ